jgi:transketolase
VSSKPEQVRSLILEVASASSEATHLGGSLSSVEIFTSLFSNVLNLKPVTSVSNSEDVFILSKGHCYLGLLATLCVEDRLKKSELLKYQSDHGPFGAHPIEGQTPDIVSSNGSLGHGLGFGLGIAFQKTIDKEPGTVYVLMGDSECSEGSVYEAALLAPALFANNLVAIIDSNSFGNDGELVYGSVDKIKGAFMAFGWSAVTVDGHSEEALTQALLSRDKTKPTLVVAKTTKGKGLPNHEGSNESHHMKFVGDVTRR